MQIRATTNVPTTTQVNFNSKIQSADSGATATRFDTTDQIDISSEAQMLAGMNDISSIRSERIDTIRQQIASGQYETAEKLDIAMDRLLDELA